MFNLEFEDELVEILNKYDENWVKEPLNSDEVEVLIGHLRNQLDLINGNITNEEYIQKECGIDKGSIYQKLDNLNNGIEDNFNLFVDIKEYKKYVELGRNNKEKLQILIMCYVDNPTIDELNNWSLNDLLDYIKETDEEFYEQDMIEIKKCIELIEKENK